MNILLVCGTGASSGFLAKNIRKAAKEKGYDISIKARGDAEVEAYIEEIDLLLVGPHLKYMMNDLEEIAEPYEVPVRLVAEELYGSMDGAGIIDALVEEFGDLNS